MLPSLAATSTLSAAPPSLQLVVEQKLFSPWQFVPCLLTRYKTPKLPFPPEIVVPYKLPSGPSMIRLGLLPPAKLLDPAENRCSIVNFPPGVRENTFPPLGR